jgi:hypothetical protein
LSYVTAYTLYEDLVKRQRPGVDVMITIFCNFGQFSAKTLAFFSNTYVMIKLF